MIHKTFQLVSRIIFKISLEDTLYAGVVRIRRKRIVQKKKTRKSKITYLFKRQSARSKHSFGIDIEWVEENFSTREPQCTIRCFKAILKVNLNQNILNFLFLL